VRFLVNSRAQNSRSAADDPQKSRSLVGRAIRRPRHLALQGVRVASAAGPICTRGSAPVRGPARRTGVRTRSSTRESPARKGVARLTLVRVRVRSRPQSTGFLSFPATNPLGGARMWHHRSIADSRLGQLSSSVLES
jgi:hypothetical protein